MPETKGETASNSQPKAVQTADTTKAELPLTQFQKAASKLLGSTPLNKIPGLQEMIEKARQEETKEKKA